jgi:membrane protease YdiL (CAAX protease family)
MKRLSTRYPFVFVLIVLVGWILTSGLASLAAAAVFDVAPTSALAQSMGTLTGTVLALLLAWRLGWLQAAGIARLGSWQVWLLALAFVAYKYIVYRYAFFGTLTSDPTILIYSSSARQIFVRQVVVGFVEEAIFRGLLLYALVRVWGTSRRGLFAATLVAALLFGVLHILQVLSGQSLASTLLVMAGCVFSGIWLGALVLRGGSIWPGVVVHAASNMVVNIGALSVAGFLPPTSAFLLATLSGLPLVLWGIWQLWQTPLGEEPAAENVSLTETRESTLLGAAP